MSGTSEEAPDRTGDPESDKPHPESQARRGTFGQILLGHYFVEEDETPDSDSPSQPANKSSSAKTTASCSGSKKSEAAQLLK
jgi:hypothetical protein